MVPGNRILTRSVKCNLFELDVDSARIYLDLGSEVYNGYPQGCPPPPPSKHWVDDLPWGFRFVCMPLCVLWVDKLSTLTLDSCQSQTQSLSPPPPLVFSSSLSLPPTHLLEQASPLGLKHMHTSSPDLLCTEFPSDVTCSPLRCSPPHFTPHLAPAERIASPRWGNRGECGLSINH